MNLLVSIHDVMPATLDRVSRIFDRLCEAGQLPVTLLVSPGLEWQTRDIDTLRGFVARGAELAGHGWRHKANSIRGVRHRVHSALISRDVAEHLALDRAGCVQLMSDCFEWFGEHDLPSPDLYVPPAWAMGSARHSDLDELPYSRFETMSGVYISRQGFRRLPMIGFEADTAFRALACRIWNRMNTAWASMNGALRIGIHPNDFELLLGKDVSRAVTMPGTPVSYSVLGSHG